MIRLRVLLAIGLCLLVFFALWPAEPAPYRWGAEPASTWGPDTVHNMQASAAYVDGQLGDGEYVFAVLPEYYSLAAHTSPMTPRIYHTVSPQHGQIEGLNQTGYHDRMRERFVAALETGRIRLLIMTHRTYFMLTQWPAAMDAFRTGYCRVEPTPAVYERTGVNLYEYAPDRGGCLNQTQFESSGV